MVVLIDLQECLKFWQGITNFNIVSIFPFTKPVMSLL